MRLVFLLFLAGGLLLAADTLEPTPADAAQFHQKLLQVVKNGASEGGALRSTTFTETEANAYLRYALKDLLPAGVQDPTLRLVGQGRVGGRATVDLDAVRKQQSSGGWLDPRSYLTGQLPVTATGTLKTADGRGQFVLESAEVSGIPIPASLLQEIVSYYTRSNERPNGIDLDRPFDLPARIDRIDVHPGRATVMQ